nr:hypothetical protein [Tanacetum cinerariifolium]
MDMTIDQQVALDEALVPHASRLRIGKSNFRLRSDITSKESTLQVVYDVLILTPFYKAFLVTADVLEIYMQEFWATATVHHHVIRFKMNNKKRIVNLEYFKEMLHICPRIPNQTFDELPFTKVIINFFMTKDPSILRRNKVNWYDVKDDQMFTKIKLVSRHQNTQQFGAILPVELTNEDIRNSAAYKEYHAIASGAAPPKTKASVRKTHSSFDTTMPPPTAVGTRLSTSAKGKLPAKSSKAKGLSMLSEVALTEAEQMTLATKRSLQQTHISQASRSGADEETGLILGVPDVPTYESDEEISCKSSDEDDDDDVDDQSDDEFHDDQEDEDDDEQDDDDQDNNDDDQDSDNDGDDFVHPKLSTHDEEAKDEESFDPIVQTPSHVENSNDESNDDESRGLRANRSDEQRNLYKALVDAYECDKIILDTYGDTVMLKRRRGNEGKDEEPFAGSDRGVLEKTSSESAPAEEPMHTAQYLEEPAHLEFEIDTLTPELLAGPIYELMKGSCKCLVKLEFFLKEVYNATTDQLDWNNPEGQQDDEKLYKFKEGDLKRLHIQDIEDMLLLLVQGKLTNLTVEERFAFNVSLRMFTRSIVIQRRVKDLQLGVESYQKKLNLTKPDTYRSDLKHKEAYNAYSNPRGLIYQSKDKQNRLMRIDELHKFGDSTLNDVRTALDDRLKGIWIKYLPQTIWRRSDKERASVMI